MPTKCCGKIYSNESYTPSTQLITLKPGDAMEFPIEVCVGTAGQVEVQLNLAIVFENLGSASVNSTDTLTATYNFFRNGKTITSGEQYLINLSISRTDIILEGASGLAEQTYDVVYIDQTVKPGKYVYSGEIINRGTVNFFVDNYAFVIDTGTQVNCIPINGCKCKSNTASTFYVNELTTPIGTISATVDAGSIYEIDISNVYVLVTGQVQTELNMTIMLKAGTVGYIDLEYNILRDGTSITSGQQYLVRAYIDYPLESNTEFNVDVILIDQTATVGSHTYTAQIFNINDSGSQSIGNTIYIDNYAFIVTVGQAHPVTAVTGKCSKHNSVSGYAQTFYANQLFSPQDVYTIIPGNNSIIAGGKQPSSNLRGINIVNQSSDANNTTIAVFQSIPSVTFIESNGQLAGVDSGKDKSFPASLDKRVDYAYQFNPSAKSLPTLSNARPGGGVGLLIKLDTVNTVPVETIIELNGVPKTIIPGSKSILNPLAKSISMCPLSDTIINDQITINASISFEQNNQQDNTTLITALTTYVTDVNSYETDVYKCTNTVNNCPCSSQYLTILQLLTGNITSSDGLYSYYGLDDIINQLGLILNELLNNIYLPNPDGTPTPESTQIQALLNIVGTDPTGTIPGSAVPNILAFVTDIITNVDTLINNYTDTNAQNNIFIEMNGENFIGLQSQIYLYSSNLKGSTIDSDLLNILKNIISILQIIFGAPDSPNSMMGHIPTLVGYYWNSVQSDVSQSDSNPLQLDGIPDLVGGPSDPPPVYPYSVFQLDLLVFVADQGQVQIEFNTNIRLDEDGSYTSTYSIVRDQYTQLTGEQNFVTATGTSANPKERNFDVVVVDAKVNAGYHTYRIIITNTGSLDIKLDNFAFIASTAFC